MEITTISQMIGQCTIIRTKLQKVVSELTEIIDDNVLLLIEDPSEDYLTEEDVADTQAEFNAFKEAVDVMLVTLNKL